MKHKPLNISNFKEGDTVKGFFLCKSFQCKFTRLGDEYIDCILENSSGSIRAKIWSFIDDFKQRIIKKNPLAIKAVVISYNNNLELNISSLNIACQDIYKKYGYNDFHLVKTISNKEHLLKKLSLYIKPLNVNYRKLLNKIIKDNIDKIRSYPSVDIQYNYNGGLLKQIISVLDLNKKINYKKSNYNNDIVTAGIILKNIGVLNLYNNDLLHSITEENGTVGHRLLGINVISDYAAKFVNYPDNCKVNLQNVILLDNKINDFNLNYIKAIYEFDLAIVNSN